MNTEIFLIGKVIKGTKQEKSKKKTTQKHSLTKMFETVLMYNSSKDQANEFSEKQCLEMLNDDVKSNDDKIQLNVENNQTSQKIKGKGNLLQLQGNFLQKRNQRNRENRQI